MRLVLVFAFICLVKYSICQNVTSSSSLGESKQNTTSPSPIEANNNTISSLPTEKVVNTTEIQHGNNVTDLNFENQTVTIIPNSVESTTVNKNTQPIIVSSTVEIVATTPVDDATSKNLVASTTVSNEENESTTVQQSTTNTTSNVTDDPTMIITKELLVAIMIVSASAIVLLFLFGICVYYKNSQNRKLDRFMGILNDNADESMLYMVDYDEVALNHAKLHIDHPLTSRS